MLNYHTNANAKADAKARKDAAKSMIRPCKVYKNLNTPDDYASAPEHIRDAWDRAMAAR